MTSIFDKLAGFISGSGRGGEGRATKGKLSDFLTENSRVINQVVNDIFRPYLDPKTKKPQDIKQILSLMDTDTCSQMMIFLSNTLEANLTRYNVGSLGSSLAVLNDPNSCPKGGNCSRALNEKTVEIKPGVKISKRDMCDTIAVHYVKLLNLIGSILVAINPDTNMCLARFNNLYTLIESDEEGQAFQIGLCTDSNKKVIRESLLKEPGLAELLQLYLYHLVKQTETEADKQAVIREYANLVALFEEEGVIEPGDERTNNKSQNVNNLQKQNIPPVINNAEHGFVPELLAQEQEQQPQPQEQPSENLSAAIRRLENRFQELETSQRANRNTNRAARNSELKAEIAELKATISNLTALVKQGKATPANVSQTINTGTQTSARNISAATFNTNASATGSQASKNVNQMNTYDNSGVTNSYRDWGYGAVNNPNNSEQDSSRKLERLEGRLVKLLKKLNNNKNSQNSTSSTNSAGSSRASGYEYEAPESMTSEYTDYESNGGSSQAYNKSIQTGGSPNSINAATPENTNTIFGYSNKPNMETQSLGLENQSLGLENAVPNMDNLQSTENAGPEIMEEPSERTQEFMSASASLERFRSFMKEYIEDKPDVRNMFLKVFNAKFKAPRKEKIDRICTNAKSKGQLFTVNVAEASENSDVKAFVDNYSAMKSEYMEACGRLVDILENRILEQVPDASESQATNEPKPMRYILRDLTGAELKEIETLTRTTLAELYGKCHRRYLEGINHLDSYFFNKTKRMNVTVD